MSVSNLTDRYVFENGNLKVVNEPSVGFAQFISYAYHEVYQHGRSTVEVDRYQYNLYFRVRNKIFQSILLSWKHPRAVSMGNLVSDVYTTLTRSPSKQHFFGDWFIQK